MSEPTKYELFERIRPRQLKRIYTDRDTPTDQWEDIPDTVVDLVLDLRDSVDGSADPWPTDLLKSVVEHMRYRIDNYGEPRDEIDRAIWSIIAQGIAIGVRELCDRADSNALE